MSTSGSTQAPATSGPLRRGYMTPACRIGQQWPDLHQQCHAPGYRDRVLGWVTVPCSCTCHQQADDDPASA